VTVNKLKDAMQPNFKIGYLITAYKNQDQLVDLVTALSTPNSFFYIHIDKKSQQIDLHEAKQLLPGKNVHFLQKRTDVNWGGFSQLTSILNLIKAGLNDPLYINYFILLSNQDFPIRSNSEIEIYLKDHRENIFLDNFSIPNQDLPYNGGLGRVQWYWFMDHNTRIPFVWRLQFILQKVFITLNLKKRNTTKINIFAGSDWWMMPRYALEYIITSIEIKPYLLQIFKYSFIPSEMLFHTILCNNGEFVDKIINNNKRYIKWDSNHKGHPTILTTSDYNDIINYQGLFARKFDSAIDKIILDQIKSTFK
jgi:hypothetical protein